MESDDTPVGRVLTRREALALLGLSGITLFAGRHRPRPLPGRASALVPSCIVRPEQTEGPYFVDEKLNRSDIRADPTDGIVKDGVPLDLTLAVASLKAGSCAPLIGAHVDIWHCDALGVYSDVKDPRFNTVGQRFLRGYQLTDAAGVARFRTIYPGWYPGRTVHIHFKIRTDPAAPRGLTFTSQMYFDDALTDRVHALAPYVGKGQRRGRNHDDGIFLDGGDQLLLAPAIAGSGYAATFALGLQMA